jgi:hypothetical protein
MSVKTPPRIKDLPAAPTAAVVIGPRNRVQQPGLDEFDLEAAGDASALTGANGHRSRARKIFTELKAAAADRR